jgi:hypothetical protein
MSIIVPAWRAEAFITPCLDAILGQMGPRHELIVIDDGSPDACGELAEQACALHPGRTARVLHQPNRGVAAARNRGLEEARGEYVLFADADDVLLPGALAALDDVIAARRPDAIACDFRYWHPHNKRKNRHVALGYPAGEPVTDNDRLLQIFFADRHNYVWANAMRREIYARVPQPVFPQGRVFEDVSVLPCLLSECASLVRLSTATVAYRQHPGSITKTVSAKWCLDFAAALRQIKTRFAVRPASDLLRMQIDVTACHFYIGIVKSSCLLPWKEGRQVREQVRQLFLDSLFHGPERVLSAMERGSLHSRDHAHDAAVARQVRKALDRSLLFTLAKTASRRVRQWQRAAA